MFLNKVVALCILILQLLKAGYTRGQHLIYPGERTKLYFRKKSDIFI